MRIAPRSQRLWPWLLMSLLAVAAVPPAAASELRFARDGETLSTRPLAALRASCGEQVVEIAADPYYGTAKRFHACPLRAVLAAGFGDAEALRGQGVLLRALDGYTRSVTGDALLEAGAHLAFADADRPDGGFDPIDRRQIDPAPAYLVWTGADQNDTTRHPWPYQLATIELASFEHQFPHTVPAGAADPGPVWAGYRRFQQACASCHAINGEGGRVGPELNVPRSIVEYRPEAQIRAYIREPASFRYTSMPAHLHLDDAELDSLIAYFRHMSGRKRDPGPPAGH